MTVRLEWDGKPEKVERLSLPLQTVETINESRVTRERDSGALFSAGTDPGEERNILVWGISRDREPIAQALQSTQPRGQ
jgi:hypothetical protein